MRETVIAYFAAAVLMAGLDFLWLSLTAEPIYRRFLGGILAEKAYMPAAVAFYLIYVAGTLIFAIRPALVSGGWQTAFLRGILFGFFAYATYDLTNLATLKVWSLKVSLLDMAWGSLVTAVVASASAAFVIGLRR